MVQPMEKVERNFNILNIKVEMGGDYFSNVTARIDDGRPEYLLLIYIKIENLKFVKTLWKT